MSKSRSAKWQRRLMQPPRAVIDIGSNTVRMVIYEGTGRAPEVVWNEKVAARLGRDLSQTGRIPDEAADEALGALARYALIIGDLGIDDVQTVATAAAREAENGAQFLERVADLGLEPRLLSGEEEARASEDVGIGPDEETATKLELAYAYQKMGDSDGAKEILQEVIAEGNESQIAEARRLLESLQATS